jgi:hypothetical protein
VQHTEAVLQASHLYSGGSQLSTRALLFSLDGLLAGTMGDGLLLQLPIFSLN